MINSYDEAVELLHEAQEAYRDPDECRMALSMYRELAYWVTSERVRKSESAERLAELTSAIKRGIAGYQNCDNECLWESASSLYDIFRLVEE